MRLIFLDDPKLGPTQLFTGVTNFYFIFVFCECIYTLVVSEDLSSSKLVKNTDSHFN